jgi:hypothetical protein
VKTAYRKICGILLLGVVGLVAGCKSMLPRNNSATLQAGCEWIDFPYSFRCDFNVDLEREGESDPSSKEAGTVPDFL